MPGVIWGIFIALTALHIFANVRAMRCLQLRSLNRPRLALLLRTYMATQVSTCSGARALGKQCCDSLSVRCRANTWYLRVHPCIFTQTLYPYILMPDNQP